MSVPLPKWIVAFCQGLHTSQCGGRLVEAHYEVLQHKHAAVSILQ